MLLSAVLFFSVLYRYYEGQMFEDLSQAVSYISHGMELSGEEYLETLETENRVTWVDQDGTVLYDSRADAARMENHLDREEIREALETGTGESTHESETLLEKTLYFARLLSDGTVLPGLLHPERHGRHAGDAAERPPLDHDPDGAADRFYLLPHFEIHCAAHQ